MSEPYQPNAGSRLSWPLLLALRYLRSGRNDAFVSFLSAVAIGGIALGVAALLVALAGLAGLQRELRAEVLTRTPQIEIEMAPQGAAALAPRLLAEPGVRSVTARVAGPGWVLATGSARPVDLVGFDGPLPLTFRAATDRASGVYVDDRLAAQYGIAAGSVVEVASARPRLSPLGPLPRVRRLVVAGTYDGGVLGRREAVALPIGVARTLLGDGSYHLAVTTESLDEALRVVPRIESYLPQGARVRTWRELNAPLLFALQLEKRLMFVAVFLVVMVGALALVADLSLIIASRRGEIGILATIGADPQRLRRAFLCLGGLLAGLGASLGCVLGVAATRLLDRFELVRLPGDAYLLDHVPFDLQAGDALAVVAATFLVAAVCTWYGASRVAALRPLEALRS